MLVMKGEVLSQDQTRYGVNAGQYVASDFKRSFKEGQTNSQGGHWIKDDEF